MPLPPALPRISKPRDAYARGIRLERARAAVTVTAAAFSPCGAYLVCGSDSGRLAVWELEQHVDAEAEAVSADGA